MDDLQELALSANGDKWFVGRDAVTNSLFVLHRGNASSGGHETISSVDVFLNQQPFGPEREALVLFLEENKTTKDRGFAKTVRRHPGGWRKSTSAWAEVAD